MKADRLMDEFRAHVGAADDATLLLPMADAVELVNRAADEGVPILRIVGVEPADVQPKASPEHIADFRHDVEEGHGCWEAAEAFIRRHSALPLLFDVALGDDPLQIV